MQRKKLLPSITVLFPLGILLCLFLSPASACEAVNHSLTLCAKTLLPTLFPTFVLTDLLVSLCVEDLLPPQAAPMRWLGIGRAGLVTAILGMIGGYPHGARIAAMQVKKGVMTREEADRVTAFSSIAGPSFLIGGIGMGMMGSVRFGVWLYLIQLGASVLCAISLALICKKETSAPQVRPKNDQKISLLPLLAVAIRNGGNAMLGVAASVTFFSTIKHLVAGLIPHPTLGLCLGGFLEMSSCAAECIATLPSGILPIVLCLLVSFSGCSIHAQIALLSADIFPLRTYWIGKLLLCLYSLLLGVLFSNFL